MSEDNLSQAAQLAAQYINQTNRHVFLTGKAGTGKTTFLRYIIQHTHKKAIIVAPTGIAAINAGGSTIHSAFQLPIGAFIPERQIPLHTKSFNLHDKNSLLKNLRLSNIKRNLLREIELLIIDEVSMLRADLLDALDTVLRSVRQLQGQSFGGVQVLFIGDLLQLPPVIKEEEKQILSAYYKSPYFFEARALYNNQPVYIELDKIFRQSNSRFIELLNNFRNNTVNNQDIALLNQYYKPGFRQSLNDNYIHLTTHNYKALSINKDFLESIPKKAFTYHAEINNEFPESMYPLEAQLVLKEGAQIMFIKNDTSGKQQFFNGKLARVTSLSQDEIKVQDEHGEVLTLEMQTWENKRFIVNELTNDIETELLGSFKQYPVKLAWAITVHKSQGLSFDKAILDLSEAFAPGQVYVALSRLRDINGLILSSPLSLKVHEAETPVHEYTNSGMPQEKLEEQLKTETIHYLKYYLGLCFDLSTILNYCSRLNEEAAKIKNPELRIKLDNWIQKQQSSLFELHELALKFNRQAQGIITTQENGWQTNLVKRVSEAGLYFKPRLKDIGSSIINQIEWLVEQKKSKQAVKAISRLELLVFEQQKKISKSAGLCDALLKGEAYNRERHLENSDMVDRLMKKENTTETIAAKKTKKGAKLKKGESAQMSFDLYNELGSIEQVAQKRNLAQTTIINHLSQFIKAGKLDVRQLVAEEKIEKIKTTVFELNSFMSKSVKEKLGPDFSYGEIQCVLASLEKEMETR